MRKFNFPLEPVLEQRKKIEEEKQQTVAARKRELDNAQAHLAHLNDEFRKHADVLRGEHFRLMAEELRLHYAHLDYLDREIANQLRVVAQRRAALDAARTELLAASKERKVVEKLKERRREAHIAEELRLEQNDIDDGNARRYSRAKAATGGTP